MSTRKHDGQALIECVLSMTVIGTLFLGLMHLGQLHFQSLQTNQVARFAAFMSAQGQSKSTIKQAVGVTAVETKPLQAASTSGIAYQLEQDWLKTDTSLVAVRSALTYSQRPWQTRTAQHRNVLWATWLDPNLKLRAYTALMKGDGALSNDQDLPKQLSQSHHGWSQAYTRSKTIAEQERSRLSRSDQLWQRSRLTTDWLSSWVNAIPKERLN